MVFVPPPAAGKKRERERVERVRVRDRLQQRATDRPKVNK